MSNDYFKAQGWFKNYARSSEDSRGMFQRLVEQDEKEFKLASADTDRIKNMINKKYGPGSMKYGSEIPQPPARPDVIEIDAINRFVRDNPMAEGGRMRYKKGKLVIQPPKVLESGDSKSIRELDPEYKGKLINKKTKKVIGKVYTKELNDAFEVLNTIMKNKGHVGSLEELGRLAGFMLEGKSGKVNHKRTKLAFELATDQFDELENFKLADAKYPKIDTKKFRYLDMVAKSFANHNTAKNASEAAAHLLSDNMAKIVDLGNRTTLEKGFFNLRGKITDADKKFISERVAALTGKDFNIDNVNELIEKTSKVRTEKGRIASQIKRNAPMNADIKKLYNDEVIQNLITGDLDNKTRQKILDRAVDIVGDDVAIASRRLFQMAESMAGTRPIEGIEINTNLGKKLIDTQRIIGKNVKDGRAFSSLVYNHYAKTIDNALGTGPGKSFIGYYQQKIKNALDKGLVPDEIFSVTASARRGMHPYAIFTQALDADVNSSIKGANLDGLLSTTHRDLQNIFQGRTYDKLNTADKKAVQKLVSTFENAKKNVLKDLKPEVRDTIQLAEFDLKNPPSKSIANYDSYDKNLQKAFDKSFKDTGYSMKVTKDMKTQKELLSQIESYVTDTTGKVKQPMLSSGFAGAYEMLSDDLKKITNTEGFKNFSKIAKTPGKFFGIGDVVLGYLDYKNNIGQGMSEERATKKALQAMSFGLWKGGDREYLNELKETYIKNGGDKSAFDQVINLNKQNSELMSLVEKTKKQYQKESENEKIYGTAGGPEAIKFQLSVPSASDTLKTNLSAIKSKAENMDKDFTTFTETYTGKDLTKPSKDIKAAAFEDLAAQKRKVFDTQSRQVNTEAGPIGNKLFNSLFTKDSYKKLLPQNLPSTLNQMIPFMPFTPVTEKEKEQAYINEMAKNYPQELYRYNLERGVDPDNPVTFDATSNLIAKPELGFNFSEGGITSLRSKYEYKK